MNLIKLLVITTLLLISPIFFLILNAGINSQQNFTLYNNLETDNSLFRNGLFPLPNSNNLMGAPIPPHTGNSPIPVPLPYLENEVKDYSPYHKLNAI